MTCTHSWVPPQDTYTALCFPGSGGLFSFLSVLCRQVLGSPTAKVLEPPWYSTRCLLLSKKACLSPKKSITVSFKSFPKGYPYCDISMPLFYGPILQWSAAGNTLQKHLSDLWEHVQGEQKRVHHPLPCLMSWGLLHIILSYLGFTHLMLFFKKMPLLYSTLAYPGVVEVPTHFIWVLSPMQLSDSVTLHLPRVWTPKKSAFLLFLLCPRCSVLRQLFPNHSCEPIIHMHNRNPNTVITILLNRSLSWWLTPAS